MKKIKSLFCWDHVVKNENKNQQNNTETKKIPEVSSSSNTKNKKNSEESGSSNQVEQNVQWRYVSEAQLNYFHIFPIVKSRLYEACIRSSAGEESLIYDKRWDLDDIAGSSTDLKTSKSNYDRKKRSYFVRYHGLSPYGACKILEEMVHGKTIGGRDRTGLFAFDNPTDQLGFSPAVLYVKDGTLMSLQCVFKFAISDNYYDREYPNLKTSTKTQTHQFFTTHQDLVSVVLQTTQLGQDPASQYQCISGQCGYGVKPLSSRNSTLPDLRCQIPQFYSLHPQIYRELETRQLSGEKSRQIVEKRFFYETDFYGYQFGRNAKNLHKSNDGTLEIRKYGNPSALSDLQQEEELI